MGRAWLSSAMAVGGAVALAWAPIEAQQGRVSGTVVDERGAPVAGAQVTVAGTGIGVVADAAGRFVLDGVPGPRARVQVTNLGYRSLVREVDVPATDLRLTLEETAVNLDEIIVTGTAGGAQRRAVANAVSSVNAAAIAETAPVQSVTDMINARAPGVVIQPPSGNAGSGARILIRGRSSISLPVAPLIYVDGVRVDNSMAGSGSGFGSTSRLSDFAPGDIESIEIIKGPAAATLYGTEASNGVIQIITKKGRPGETRVDVSVEQGAAWFHDPEGRWLLNYFEVPETGEIIEYNLAQQETDRGTPLFRTGHLQSYALGVSGGSEAFQYRIGANYDRDEGAVPDNVVNTFSGRLNVTGAPSDRLDIEAQLGVTLNRADLVGGSYMFDAILSRPSTRNTSQRGFFTAPSETRISQFRLLQKADHVTAGTQVRHQPFEWLSHRLRAGFDLSNADNNNLTRRMPPEHGQFFSPAAAAGQKVVSQTNVLNTTVDYSATGTFTLTEGIGSATTGGFQYYRRNTTLLSATGLEFPAPDVTAVAGAAQTFGSDDEIENVTVGVFAQQLLSWRDRLFLTAAVRGDDNSAFGEQFDFVTYPKFSASWVLSDEPFWTVGAVEAFRLRAAWGKSGQQPQAFAALRTFAPITAQAGAPGVTPQFVGNPDLGPEKSTELELGFEAGLFQDRVNVDFTWYDQRTEDAIILRDVAPSTGFPRQQFVNAGEVRNRGVELLVNVNPVRTDKLDWTVGFNFSTNDNEVVRIGIPGTDYLEFGFGNRFMPGYSVYAAFARKVVSAEFGPDGQPTNILCDGGRENDQPGGAPVPCATAPRVFIGDVDPTSEGAISSTLRLFGRWRLYGLVDFKRGHHLWTSTLWCPGILDCEEEVYPERFSPEIAASSVLGLTDDARWWRDMSFAKLREVSLTYEVPSSWASRFGASRANITVGARNLYTWTDFEGLDPENMSLFPEADAFGTPFEQNEVPQLMQLVTKINLTF